MTASNSEAGITEDISLNTRQHFYRILGRRRTKLTATILATPMIEDKIPDAMTRRQSASPRFSTLVASLLRCPKMLKPRINIARPRGTKPDSGLSSGQYRAKYDLKRVSSETIRKRPIVLVMKCETPSKKKNCQLC